MHYQDESNYHLNLNNKMIIIQMITLNVLYRIRRRRRRIKWQSHICSRKFRIVNIHVYHIQFHVQCSRNLAQPECCHEGITFDKSQSQYAREWMAWCFIALERIGFEFKLRFQVLLVIMPTKEREKTNMHLCFLCFLGTPQCERLLYNEVFDKTSASNSKALIEK